MRPVSIQILTMINLPDRFSIKMAIGYTRLTVTSIKRETAATDTRTPVNATSMTNWSRPDIA